MRGIGLGWGLFVPYLIGVGIFAYFWFIAPPSYRASAVVRVESSFPKRPMEIGETMIHVELMDRFVDDQIQLIQDESVLREALPSSVVRETSWYLNHPDKKLMLLELQQDLDVNQIPGSNCVLITFPTKNRLDAPKIVNTVVEKYIRKVENMSRDQYSSELTDYRRREEKISLELEKIRRLKQDFLRTEMSTSGVTAGINVVGETWRTLAQEVTQLEAEKLQYKAAYENLVGISALEIATSPRMGSMIKQDPQVTKLRDIMFDLEIQIELEKATSLPAGSPTVEKLTARRDALEIMIAEMTARKRKEVRDYQLNSAHTLFLNAVQAELQLRKRMEEAECQQRDLDRQLEQFRNLEEEQLMFERQLDDVRKYINQLLLVIKDRGTVHVRQIGQAQVPLVTEIWFVWLITRRPRSARV